MRIMRRWAKAKQKNLRITRSRKTNARVLSITSSTRSRRVYPLWVVMTKGEAFLLGAQVTPLDTVSTHYVVEKARSRKLLLQKKELAKINQALTQKGQTCVCTALYWKGHLVKAKIAIAQGKKQHDKRDTEKQRDWQRDKARIVRDNVKQ